MTTEPFDNPSPEDLDRFARTLAPRAFNHTWELLDREERSSEAEEEMLGSAFTQRQLWYQVGTPRHRAIADWQVSRVAVVLGYADLARRFGEVSLTVAIENDLDPFVTAYAHEAIARAADEVDDYVTRDRHVLAARELALEIEDEEDRTLLLTDLELIPVVARS
jgi:hypothetical protein